MTLDARFVQRPMVGAWADHAACAGADVDIRLFYPASGATARRAFAAAKAICGRCPVRDDCRRHALEYDEGHGTWGGLSERERRAIRRSGHVGDVALRPCVCQMCDAPFMAESPRASLCSDDCQRAYRAQWERNKRAREKATA